MNNEKNTRVNCGVEMLTPLHIGDNDAATLSSFTDFVRVAGENSIQLVDRKKLEKAFEENESIMEAYLDEIKQRTGKSMESFSIKNFFNKHDVGDDQFLSSRVLPCKGKLSGAEIHPFIAENGKRFIPGSSLKGAIRTAFAYYFLLKNQDIANELIKEVFRKDSKMTRNRNPFRSYDTKIFGSDPKFDLFKYLIISDTDPFLGESIIFNTHSYNIKKGISHDAKEKRKGAGIQINYECLPPESESTFSLSMKQIPDKFFKNSVNSNRDKGMNKFWREWNSYSIDNIFKIINTFYLRFVEWELDLLNSIESINPKNYNNLKCLIDFYSEMKQEIEKNISEGNETAFLCVGKGTTFLSKTIGLIFKDCVEEKDGKDGFEQFRNIMKNSKAKRNLGWVDGKASSVFPLTRLVYMEGDIPQNVFGWIKIRKA